MKYLTFLFSFLLRDIQVLFLDSIWFYLKEIGQDSSHRKEKEEYKNLQKFSLELNLFYNLVSGNQYFYNNIPQSMNMVYLS